MSLHARKLLVIAALASVAPLSAEHHPTAVEDLHGHAAIEECPVARSQSNAMVVASAEAAPLETAYLAGRHYVAPLLP